MIGAGPAGSAAAWACASFGLRTLVVEKAEFPRSKVCGGCVSPSGMASLKTMGIDGEVRRLGAPIHSFTLQSRGRTLRVDLARQGVAIGRDVLDAMLLDNARSRGAHAMSGAGATFDGVESGLCRMKLAGRDWAARVTADVMIVADGLSGTFLPKSGAWRAEIAPRSRFGVGTRIDGERFARLCPSREIAMRCGSAGYFGAVRLEDGSMDVAAALSPRRTRQLGGPGAAIREIARESGLGNCADILAGLSWRGTGLLTRRRRVESDRIFVIGDAAEYVEPFTGEGITWAMEAGLAVASFARAVCAREYKTGAWTDASNRLAKNRRVACRVAAQALRFPGAISFGISVANRIPAIRACLATAISGPWRTESSEFAAT